MLRLIETASAALAATSMLALALGGAIMSKPSWANEPLNPLVQCDNCVMGCPLCGGSDCENSQRGACDCTCTKNEEAVNCPNSPYYWRCEPNPP
jgi:hypothetical protein